MKQIIFCIIMLTSIVALAEPAPKAESAQKSSGQFVLGGYYIDDADVNQVAPTAGIAADCHLGDFKFATYVGVGHMPAPKGVDLPNSGNWAEGNIEVSHGLPYGLELAAGGGLVSDKTVYHQFEDYLHAKLSYKLW